MKRETAYLVLLTALLLAMPFIYSQGYSDGLCYLHKHVNVKVTANAVNGQFALKELDKQTMDCLEDENIINQTTIEK